MYGAKDHLAGYEKKKVTFSQRIGHATVKLNERIDENKVLFAKIRELMTVRGGGRGQSRREGRVTLATRCPRPQLNHHALTPHATPSPSTFPGVSLPLQEIEKLKLEQRDWVQKVHQRRLTLSQLLETTNIARLATETAKKETHDIKERLIRDKLMATADLSPAAVAAAAEAAAQAAIALRRKGLTKEDEQRAARRAAAATAKEQEGEALRQAAIKGRMDNVGGLKVWRSQMWPSKPYIERYSGIAFDGTVNSVLPRDPEQELAIGMQKLMDAIYSLNFRAPTHARAGVVGLHADEDLPLAEPVLVEGSQRTTNLPKAADADARLPGPPATHMQLLDRMQAAETSVHAFLREFLSMRIRPVRELPYKPALPDYEPQFRDIYQPDYFRDGRRRVMTNIADASEKEFEERGGTRPDKAFMDTVSGESAKKPARYRRPPPPAHIQAVIGPDLRKPKPLRTPGWLRKELQDEESDGEGEQGTDSDASSDTESRRRAAARAKGLSSPSQQQQQQQQLSLSMSRGSAAGGAGGGGSSSAAAAGGAGGPSSSVAYGSGPGRGAASAAAAGGAGRGSY